MERENWLKQSRQENVIYLVMWGLLFAAPLLSMYVRMVSEASLGFDWAEVLLVWRKFALFLLLFLIHNFLLAPLLVHAHKRMTYFSFVAVVIAAFTLYQCTSRPKIPTRHSHSPRMERTECHQPPMEADGPPMAFDVDRPSLSERPPRELRHNGPPPIIGEHDILSILMLVLMFAANVGVKGFFRGRDDRKRLVELECEHLEQQLEYLRYQINPHFFMNTLNNIHALVDIDPEKAKETILELSKMMRFLLYEGNKQGVPLSRELDFIRHYVALMQLRYTDKVRITTDLPRDVADRQVPPLILITFIENAFKHGISYQRDSFIEIKVATEEKRLRFSCRNSKAEKPNEEKGGVGLTNVRKRLSLLYGKNYTLSIHDAADTYSVELNMPLL